MVGPTTSGRRRPTRRARVQGDDGTGGRRRRQLPAGPCRATPSTAGRGGRCTAIPCSIGWRRRSTSPTRRSCRPRRPTARRARWCARMRRASIRRSAATPATPKAAAAAAAAAARKAAWSARARAASASSPQARRSTGRPTCGAASAARSKAIRRPPRRAPPTSPTRGCRRRPTWRSTTSRCASPSSACGSSRRRWRPLRARPRSCRTSSTPASSRRVDLAQAQTQLEQTRAQLVAENINRATFEHAVAVLVGKSPAEFSVEPGPRAAGDVPTVDAGLPSALLERRPDIASAERQMAAANAQIGVAQAGLLSRHLARQHRHPGRQQPARRCCTLSNAVWSVGPQLAAHPDRRRRAQGPGRGRAGQLRRPGRALPPDHPRRLPAGRGCAGPAARPGAAGAGAARSPSPPRATPSGCRSTSTTQGTVPYTTVVTTQTAAPQRRAEPAQSSA